MKTSHQAETHGIEPLLKSLGALQEQAREALATARRRDPELEQALTAIERADTERLLAQAIEIRPSRGLWDRIEASLDAMPKQTVAGSVRGSLDLADVLPPDRLPGESTVLLRSSDGIPRLVLLKGQDGPLPAARWLDRAAAWADLGVPTDIAGAGHVRRAQRMYLLVMRSPTD
jgi:hypothetical protein